MDAAARTVQGRWCGMSLIEEKTLADHDINVRSIRQELKLLEEQLKKHGKEGES